MPNASCPIIGHIPERSWLSFLYSPHQVIYTHRQDPCLCESFITKPEEIHKNIYVEADLITLHKCISLYMYAAVIQNILKDSLHTTYLLVNTQHFPVLPNILKSYVLQSTWTNFNQLAKKRPTHL